MSARKLSNIPLKKFRKFLKDSGLNLIKTSKGRGGHEKWSSQELDRPITIQTHIDPVPQFIVQQVLRHLKIDKDEFFKILDGEKSRKKGTTKPKTTAKNKKRKKE